MQREDSSDGMFLFSPVLGSFLIPYLLNLILAKYEVSELAILF